MTDRAHRPMASVVLLAGVLLVAANLRPTLVGVGPLLPSIMESTGLSASAAGVLNAVPLLAFGAASVFVPRLAVWLGTERALLVALLVLSVGTLLRSTPSNVALFGGTAVIGLGIAVGNVLLPSVVKRDFPGRVSTVTGWYAAVMSLVAAVASGVAVPVAHVAPGGWRTSLAAWAFLAVVVAGIWAVVGLRPQQPPASSAGSGGAGSNPAARIPWWSPLAWQVTVFMGLQSLGFYVVIGWLPSLVQSRGMSAATGGWLLLVYQGISVVVYIVTPMLVRRLPDQRYLASGAGLLFGGCIVGLLVAPQLVLLWVVLMGAGSGTCMVLALSFFSLRAADAQGAAALSGMGQSVGYLLAAGGPALFGVLHDVTEGWTVPLLTVAAFALVQACAGFAAGRDRVVQARHG